MIGMPRYFRLQLKIWGSFVLFMIIDFFLLGVLLNVRASRTTGVRFAINDPFIPILWPTVFLSQIIFVFYGFLKLYRSEAKYEIYPTDQGEDITYHYFNSKQLLVFINIVTKSLTGKDENYNKIYVTKEAKPRLFSFQLFGRRVIILNPTILQIAETQELRASLALDSTMTGDASFIRIFAQQFRYFYFLPFITPFVPILREIVLVLIEPRATESEPLINELVILLFTLIFLFIAMSSIRWIHSILLKSANKSLIIRSDLQAADFVGARAIINTLLKLGQRQEAIEILLDEVHYLEELERGRIWEGSFEESKLLNLVQRFPISQIDRAVARDLAPEIFLQERLETLTDIYLCEIENIKEIVNKTAKSLKEKRTQFIDEWKEKIVENPQERPPNTVKLALSLDSDKIIQIEELGIDPESLINEVEIEALIEEIIKKPRRALFVHQPSKTSFWSSDLPIADRIVIIWQKSNFKK